MQKTRNRGLCILTCIILCLTFLPSAIFAAVDNSRSYNFQLTVNGAASASVAKGDEITLEVVLERTDSGKSGSYSMHSMQDEIIFNGSCFSLVESSKEVAEGYNFNVRPMDDGIHQRIILSRMVLSLEGVSTPDRLVIATFKLKAQEACKDQLIESQAYKVNTVTGDTYVTTANNVTVTVQGLCTVTFNSNGGTSVNSQTVNLGDKVRKPEAPQKAGYIFAGWYRDQELKVPWDFESNRVEGNMTLYAKWTSPAGGGSVGGGAAPPVAPGTELNTEHISSLVNSNQPLTVEKEGLQVSLNPAALSSLLSSVTSGQTGASGTLSLEVNEISEPGALNTFFLRYPEQKGIMKGYSINLTRQQDGKTENITSLNGEITLSFALSPAELEGLNPESLMVYKQADNGSISVLPGAYDWATGTLTVSTSHLCQFFIMGKEGTPTQRLAGGNRYATAAAISAGGWRQADTVVLASGENFPDALSGTVLAALNDAPILLTAKNVLSAETKAELKSLQAKTVYLLGGTGVISQNVESQLSKDYTVIRIAGTNRFETAVEIGKNVRQKASASKDTVILATGNNYPDALSIASFAGQYGIPVLFSGQNDLNEFAGGALKEWGIQKVIICGGNSAISARVETALKEEMGLDVTRLAGDSRYLTALAIAKYFGAARPAYTLAALATGENFPDALAGAALTSKLKLPLLLVQKNQVQPQVKDYLRGLNAEKLYIFGGQAVITDKVRDEVSVK